MSREALYVWFKLSDILNQQEHTIFIIRLQAKSREISSLMLGEILKVQQKLNACRIQSNDQTSAFLTIVNF